MYAVILAGGGGTRLWPLSRPERPKPFLPLLGEETLIQQTVARLRGPGGGRPALVSEADTFVVTDRRYAGLVREQLPGVAIVEEPQGRNTAAAIALATYLIERPEDEVMLVLPADHAIADGQLFRDTLFVAVSGLAATNPFGVELPLVTLGVTPTRPATEYGYVLPRQDAGLTVSGVAAYPVERFEEKPGPARAAELLRLPGAAWNAGMFIWQRGAIRDAIARCTQLEPVLGPVTRSMGGYDAASLAARAGTPEFVAALSTAYAKLDSISIDYAVLEPAAAEGRVLVAALDVGWTDIGGWHALLGALPGSGNSGSSGRVVAPGEWITLQPDDLLVHTVDGHLVVSPGPSDGLVLDAHGALLVGGRERRADVEALIARVAAAASADGQDAARRPAAESDQPAREAERT